MKPKFLATLCFLTSSILSAQVQDKTLAPSESVNPDTRFGKLILEMPFSAKLYKASNASAQELLANIIGEFKGKAILIDFWAVWCSPCIKQMEYSKRLHADAKNLSVEFVYLCTSYETSMNEWITKVSLLRIPGTHLFVNENLESDLANLFSKGGFPNYLFITDKGECKPDAVTRLDANTDIKRILEMYNK